MPTCRAKSLFRVASIIAIILCALFFLAGCVTPHRFTARLELKENGYYYFTYSGTYWDHDIVMAFHNGRSGPIVPDHENVNQAVLIEQKADRMVQFLSKHPDIVSYEHLGGGLFAICYEKSGNIHEYPLIVVNEHSPLFSFKSVNNGSAAIFSSNFVTGGMGSADRLSMRLAQEIDGTIEFYSELPVVAVSGDDRIANGQVLTWRVKGWNPRQEPILARISLSPGLKKGGAL